MEPGRARRLAEFLSCSKTAVSLWRDNGVPMDRMQPISEFTQGDVSVDDMLRHAFDARTRQATPPEPAAQQAG
jgi:hypothetical protein